MTAPPRTPPFLDVYTGMVLMLISIKESTNGNENFPFLEPVIELEIFYPFQSSEVVLKVFPVQLGFSFHLVLNGEKDTSMAIL